MFISGMQAADNVLDVLNTCISLITVQENAGNQL